MFHNLFTTTVVYDPAVWTEFGFTVQRYIGSAATVGLRIFAWVFGIPLIFRVIRWFLK